MIQGPIAPLAPAFEMDAVERALRSGGEREAAKRTEEDAGTIAGGCGGGGGGVRWGGVGVVIEYGWRFAQGIDFWCWSVSVSVLQTTAANAPTMRAQCAPHPQRAGTNHPALRYWMRSIREGGYMVLSYAAQGVGAPLWKNQQLGTLIPQVGWG